MHGHVYSLGFFTKQTTMICPRYCKNSMCESWIFFQGGSRPDGQKTVWTTCFCVSVFFFFFFFFFFDGNVPRSPSYGVYISQLIRFARVCSYVDDFNKRNVFLTAKLLKQCYRYHKNHKNSSATRHIPPR